LTTVALVVGGIGLGLLGWYSQLKRHRALPDVSDAQFGEYIRAEMAIDSTVAIAERRQIARVIGIAPEKLSPQMVLSQLVAGPLDSATRVGLGDLEFDLNSLAKKAGVTSPLPLPQTVAGLVKLRIDLKR